MIRVSASKTELDMHCEVRIPLNQADEPADVYARIYWPVFWCGAGRRLKNSLGPGPVVWTPVDVAASLESRQYKDIDYGQSSGYRVAKET